MNWNDEVGIWNNPLRDLSSEYWRNGLLMENGGKFNIVLSEEELMVVVGYMLMGMNKVEAINKKEGS